MRVVDRCVFLFGVCCCVLLRIVIVYRFVVVWFSGCVTCCSLFVVCSLPFVVVCFGVVVFVAVC